jgi:hypothetical protein
MCPLTSYELRVTRDEMSEGGGPDTSLPLCRNLVTAVKHPSFQIHVRCYPAQVGGGRDLQFKIVESNRNCSITHSYYHTNIS